MRLGLALGLALGLGLALALCLLCFLWPLPGPVEVACDPDGALISISDSAERSAYECRHAI